MKKTIFLPFLLTAGIVNAQIQLGIKGGVNISNFTGGDFGNIDKSPLTSFHAGGLLRWKLEHLIFQGEVLYSEQGAKLKDSSTERNYKLSYVNVPIVLQYAFKGGFYLEAGPQVGFKVNENVPDNSNGNKFAKNEDFSVALGLGFMKDHGFGIGGRYTVGVTNVGNSSSSNYSSDFKNGVIQFSLMYVFGKKKEEQK
jgi:hypothetical protein